MSTLIRDVVYAVRSLRKRPGFAVVTVLTLALGIGANTAIFSVVNGVVLRPLGYPEPGRLVFITSQFPTLGFDQFWVSPPEFLDFRQMNRSFESVGAYRVGAANLGTDRPTRPVAAEVSDDLLTTLGVEPLAGRLFTRDDTLPGAEPVALLSYDLWQKAFDGEPVGRRAHGPGGRRLDAHRGRHAARVRRARPARRAVAAAHASTRPIPAGAAATRST